MSVNIKKDGILMPIANNTSIAQADWNEKDNMSTNSRIKNQPDTLKTLEEINSNIKDNALAGATAVKELNDNVDVINNKMDILINPDLGIKKTTISNNIHLDDSADSKLVKLALYGKVRQNTTSGKNMLQNNATNKTVHGLNFEVNKDKSVTVNGTHNLTTAGTTSLNIFGTETKNFMPNTNYLYSIGISALGSSLVVLSKTNDGVVVEGNYKIVAGIVMGDNSIEFSLTQEDINSYPYLFAQIGISYHVKTVDNLTFHPMIRLASIEDDTWESYTGGIPSPNPDYPQDIQVAGESYNLLKSDRITKESIYNGVKFILNDDGSVTANGTATDGIWYSIFDSKKFDIDEECILSGSPIDSSYEKYSIVVTDRGENNTSDGANYYDYGNGVKFMMNSSSYYRVNILVRKDVTINETFYPMIRKASVKNDRYMPYGVGSVEVKSVGKNLLDNTYTSKTVYGVDFTVNNDKSVILNGTAEKSVAGPESTIGTLKLKKGKYILSGCPSGGSNETYRLIALATYEDGTTDTWRTFGNEVEFNIQKEVREINVRVDILSGYTANNLTFYPMIRLASDTDATYEPYKKITATIPTDGIAGIKVSSGGNYTDNNGQQWICDEIVKYADGSGEKIQRVEKKRLTSDLNITKSSNTNVDRYLVTINPSPVTQKYSICTFATFTNNIQDYVIGEFGLDTNINNTRFAVNFAEYGTTTLDDFKTFLDGGEYYCLYVLPEPIRTPLTAEEISEIEKLSTFYPVTNISNDFDCGMQIEYVINNSIITTSKEIPVVSQSGELQDGDNIVTLFGKIKKWLSSIKPHAFTNPTNNLLATVPGTPLDAVQGKALNDGLINKVDKIFIDTKENRYFEFTAKPAIAYYIVVRSTGTNGANGMEPIVFILEMNRDLATYRGTLIHGSALPTITLTNGVFNINTATTYTRASIIEMC